jgi:hypothetical protein
MFTPNELHFCSSCVKGMWHEIFYSVFWQTIPATPLILSRNSPNTPGAGLFENMLIESVSQVLTAGKLATD